MSLMMTAAATVIGGAALGTLGFVAKRAVGAISEVMSGFREFMEEHRILIEAERNDLKSHIVAIFERANERGYITPSELETCNRLYDSYKRLGGNSYIEAIMHILNECMPIVGMPIPEIVAAMDAAGKEHK